jgi:hypothetical protein
MKTNQLWRLGVVALLLPLGACGDFLEVTNPGPIRDADLNDEDAISGLVVGMSSDLSEALDDLIFSNSVMADEMAHGGSYSDPGLFYRGIIQAEDINGEWGDMHRARWVAEQGIERMKSILGDKFDRNVNSARANLFAAFSNRVLGENVCFAVIDNGPKQDHTVHFERAEQQFSEALRIAQALGKAELATAALAGRAQVRAALGNWDAAVQDAGRVPSDFVFEAVYSDNSSRERNYVYYETFRRNEITVYNTQWADVKEDPRVPWSPLLKGGAVLTGADGKTPFYQQQKYPTSDSDIPLAKGTEMRLIEAEAALRRGDVAGAFAAINAQREFHKLDPLSVPSSEAGAWEVLQQERGAVLWLESRRFWDLRRWFAEGRNNFLEGRDKCIPISQNELNANPNLKGG